MFASPSNTGKADLEYWFLASVQLSSVLGGSYDWFRDSASTNSAVQAPISRFIMGNANGNAFTAATYLIYEPVYNGVSPAPVNAWQTSTFDLNGRFWVNNNNLTRAAGVPSCTSGGSCFDSLGDWASVNPNLTIIGLSTGVGSGWNNNFLGAVDNVSANFGASGPKTFNFEVVGLNAVPEPDSWAMMIVGFGLVGFAARRRAKIAVAD